MESFVYHRPGYTVKSIINRYVKRTCVPDTKQGIAMLRVVMKECADLEQKSDSVNDQITYRFISACLAGQCKYIEDRLPPEKKVKTTGEGPKRRTQSRSTNSRT